MDKHDVLAILQAHQPELRAMGVRSLALFGSCARGEAGPNSDVDLLVEFAVPVGLFHFSRLQRRLVTLLGRPVDLVTPDALRPAMRDQILRESVYAA